MKILYCDHTGQTLDNGNCLVLEAHKKPTKYARKPENSYEYIAMKYADYLKLIKKVGRTVKTKEEK